MLVVFIVDFLQVQLVLIDFLEAKELAYFVIGSWKIILFDYRWIDHK